MLLQKLLNLRTQAEDREEGEPAPEERTLMLAGAFLAGIPPEIIGKPEVNPFWGEVHLAWRNNDKQVVLMCFPNRPPLVHHYPQKGEPEVEAANSQTLNERLRWLSS